MTPSTAGARAAAGTRRRIMRPPGPGEVATRMNPASGRSSSKPADVSSRLSAVGTATPMTGACDSR